MKRKFEFDNIYSANVFDDIIGEVCVKYSNIKFDVNKEKFYFILEVNDESFEEVKNNVIDIIKNYVPNIELKETDVEETYRKIVYLENLDCANCAGKVERIAKRMFKHESIIVDFATTRFIIETTDKELIDNIETELLKVTKQVDVNIIPKIQRNEKVIENKTDNKINKTLVIIGSILFAAALILHYLVFNHTCRDEGFNPNDLSDMKVREHLVLIIMYGITYVLLGYDVIMGAFRNIKSGRVFDEKFLMTIATIMAFIIGSYTEAVSVMVFYKIGELLQEYAVNTSRKSINSLIAIKSDYATVIVNDKEMVVAPQDIIVNDIVVVKPGERIPLDGVVVEGEASLDTSALTGESKYLDVCPNTKVLSGSIVINGYLKIKVNKPYKDSMVSKIIDMVSNASLKKANTENIVTRFAKFYTPIVCILSLLIIILNLIIYRNEYGNDTQQYIHECIYPAMIFLVVSCPCALIISVPLGFFGGIGAASKKGILVKGSNYLENLSKVGLVVFDKTGTLTKGKFTIKEIKSEGLTESQLLKYAAYCEVGSIHPIAKSIVEKYGRDNIDYSKITYVPAPSKKGSIIKLEEDVIAVGNFEFMKEIKIKVPKIKTTGLMVYIVVNDKYEGYITLEDEIREESFQTIKDLQSKGIDVAMVTGDTEDIANEVADKLGITKVYANMSPIDKVRRIRKFKKNYNHQTVAFVGDGMNDAPVLGCADVGIAMGGLGSDAAIEVADIVLMTDDLSKLKEALKISKKTMKVVKQNIYFSMIIKIMVLISATIDSFIPDAEFTKMWEGVFADVGVTVIAIINAMRTANVSEENIFKVIIKKLKNKKE